MKIKFLLKKKKIVFFKSPRKVLPDEIKTKLSGKGYIHKLNKISIMV